MKELALHLLLMAFQGRTLEHLGEGEQFTAEQVAGAMNKAMEETMDVIHEKFQRIEVATKEDKPS